MRYLLQVLANDVGGEVAGVRILIITTLLKYREIVVIFLKFIPDSACFACVAARMNS